MDAANRRKACNRARPHLHTCALADTHTHARTYTHTHAHTAAHIRARVRARSNTKTVFTHQNAAQPQKQSEPMTMTAITQAATHLSLSWQVLLTLREHTCAEHHAEQICS